MSQAVNPYLILDDRLNIKDSINFGVQVGPQSANQQQFQSQTASPTNISFNVLVPSLSTVIDRHVLIRSTLVFTITGTTVDNTKLVNYPADTCLSNFPFSQCINTLSVQINNSTVNSNYADTLNLMLRQMSEKDLAKYSDLTPTQLDVYQSTAVDGSLSPFKDISNAFLADVLPRGSWALDSITGNDQGADDHTVVITVTVTEPIFLSPFLFGDGLDNHASGLSGVSAMNFNFNMSSDVNRAWRMKAGTRTGLNVSLTSVTKSELLVTFLSPKPNVLIPLSCTLPYMELPVFKTVRQGGAGVDNFSINSSVISPNAIPDRVILAVRKVVNTQAITENEYYYPISQVQITWGTQSGVLASATLQELYTFSKQAGLNMKYPQFLGRANLASALPNIDAAKNTTNISLTGGFVILEFNTIIPVMEAYYSASSLGNWTFSVNVTCQNIISQDALIPSPAIPATELIVCFVNSGVFQSTAGSSSQYIGLLSKDIVLKTSQEEPIVNSENHRLIGAGFWSSIKSALPSIQSVVKNVAPLAKNYLKGQDSKVAQGAVSALGALGYGKGPRHY
jgi:hypothetical protein